MRPSSSTSTRTGGALAWKRRSRSGRLEELRCAAAAGGPPLEVATLGGSMTKGTGCGRAAECPWPARPRRGRPATRREDDARVRVHNLAVSGTCTGCVTATLPPPDMTVPNVSVVLWDYGADADAHKAVYRQGRFKDLRVAAADVLLRELLSRDPPPVVVVIEALGPSKRTPQRQSTTTSTCDHRARQAPRPSPPQLLVETKCCSPTTNRASRPRRVWWFLAARPTDVPARRAQTLPPPLTSVAASLRDVRDYYASLPPGEPSLGTVDGRKRVACAVSRDASFPSLVVPPRRYPCRRTRRQVRLSEARPCPG